MFVLLALHRNRRGRGQDSNSDARVQSEICLYLCNMTVCVCVCVLSCSELHIKLIDAPVCEQREAAALVKHKHCDSKMFDVGCD